MPSLSSEVVKDPFAKQIGGEIVQNPFKDSADTTPIPLGQPDTNSGMTVLGGSYPQYSSALQTAASKGVDFTTPPPMDTTFTGFAANNDQIVRHLNKKGFKTRIGEDTGQIEYLSPQTNRWTTLNPAGIDSGDFAPVIGESLVFGPELLGGLVGGIAGAPSGIGALASTVGGGAAGAFIGEITRLGIGRTKYGIDADVPFSDWINSAVEEASKEAGLSVAGGAVGALAIKVGKGILNFMNDRWLPIGTKDIAEVVDLPEYKIIDEVNSKIEGQFKPTAGQISGNTDLLSTEQGLRGTSMFGPELRQQFNTREVENAQGLKEYFDKITGFTESGDRFEVGSPYVSTAKQIKERKIQDLEGRQSAAQQAMDKARNDLPETSFDEAITKARDAIEVNQEKFYIWARKAYSDLDKYAVSPDGAKITIPNISTVRAANELSGEITAVQKLFPAASSDIKSVIGPRYELDEAGEKVLRKVYDKDSEFTFEEAQLGISYLKSLSRALNSTPGANDKTKGAVKKMIKAMVTDRERSALKNPELARKLYDLEQMYAKGKQKYFGGLAKRIMQKDSDGIYRMDDERAFRSIMKRMPGVDVNSEALGLREAIGTDRKALGAMRDAIHGFYKNQVYDEGVFDPKAHRQFLKDYQSSIRPFFTAQDWKVIGEAKNMGEAYQKISDRKQRILKLLDNRAGSIGAISSLDPSDIGKYIGVGRPGSKTVTDLDLKRIQNVKTIIARDQESWEGLKQYILQDIKKTVFSGDEKLTYREAAFRSYLDNNKRSIKEVFGVATYNDMETLYSALKISQRKAQVQNTSQSALTVLDLARMAYLGPLSRKGYVYRGVRRWRQEQAKKAIANSLLNPESIREIAELSKLDPTSLKAGIITGSLISTSQ